MLVKEQLVALPNAESDAELRQSNESKQLEVEKSKGEKILVKKNRGIDKNSFIVNKHNILKELIEEEDKESSTSECCEKCNSRW